MSPPHPLLPDVAADLPPRLAERIEPLNHRPIDPGGSYVLYWMRTAVRAEENPALDTAVALANALGLSAFVYHALDERYPFASDRHHTFILQGARDVAADLARRGIGTAFHLARPGHRGPHLATLARWAAAVVTEDMPTVPMRRWTRRLARTAPVAVLAVDTACVLPMRLVRRAYDRAFAFRKATASRRHERLAQPWPDLAPEAPAVVPGLPFEPVDLATASIPELVADCEIDHAVGPVPHTPGGTAAGYARWTAFRDDRLKDYARRRNDPLDRAAVSRLSAYLHYGQVSPFRIAREAAAVGGGGPEKFLDELLVWREMAYAFCKYVPDPESLAAIPDWARDSLAAAQLDRRGALHTWEEMARGRTADPLWNAAQWSLLRHGELHNNLRMTWGKEVLRWTPDAAAALDRLIDLNHRYALDGRDPNSYGGILWCLGAFDRPFDPPQPVFGRVRPRSAAQHAKRLDLAAFTRSAAAPAADAPAVAVVGGGIAGLACARTLADHGWSVTVFDKGRGPGGRMSTRRTDAGRFDHGAQYFTADDARFGRFVESWVAAGVAAPWKGRIVRLGPDGLEATRPHDRFVGTPGMSAILTHLSTDLEIRFGVRVGDLSHSGGAWSLTDESGVDLGRFGAVVVAVPAPQAEALLRPIDAALADRSAVAAMAPCWAVMAAYDRPPVEDFVGAFCAADAGRPGGALAWIGRNGTKPERRGETWVLHASPDWSRAHLEEPADRIADALLEAFGDALTAIGRPRPPAPAFAAAHRWRFARAEGPFDGPDAPIGADGTLALCGDWLRGARVEDAWLSGMAAAGQLLGRAAPAPAPAPERTAALSLFR